MSLSIRRRIPVAFIVLLSACGPVAHPGLGSDARHELDRAQEAATRWITRARTGSDLDAHAVIAAGYLERLRLGLGSPFRLIEYALSDPRLPDSTRTQVAWALLGRTLARDAYQVDPAALDRIGLSRLSLRPEAGLLHLDLIDNAIRQSSDPRAGELAVRLAYTLASAAGDLSGGASEVAARAAAVICDRELAREDARRLLAVAQDSGTNALLLIPRWRAERRFRVEAPPMQPLDADAEKQGLEVAPRLAHVIRNLVNGRVEGRNLFAERLQRPASLLGPLAARLLEAQADTLGAPPETPIAIATLLHRELLLQPPWAHADQRVARERFVRDAINEETFAALYAGLHARSPYDAGPAATALMAAVALRAYAQEPVWLPGSGGPSVRELQERWGLAGVTFADDVPPSWRPYFRRMLDLSLADMSRVLPALDLHGLSVRFTDEARADATLALHDPRHRRLLLPPATSAGTLAHEIAHDLDWQVALERYRVRGDYASDRAVRMASDRFGARLQDLAAASMESEDGSAHAHRPAEIFARNVDWFVAATLAAQGRTNGYLSSVQDEMLTGYGSVRPPDISGAAGHALITILDNVAPLYPATREWFVNKYGLARALTPHDLVQRVVEASTDAGGVPAANNVRAGSVPGEAAFQRIEQARDIAFAAIDAWVCRTPGVSFYREYEVARRELVLAAAKARARGVSVDIARQLGGGAAAEWVARRLDEERGPWGDAPDSTVRAVLDPVVQRAQQVGTVVLPSTAPRIDIVSVPMQCRVLPFSAVTAAPK